MLSVQIFKICFIMAVIAFKIPYWYEIPYMFHVKQVEAGEYQVFDVVDGDTFTIHVKGTRVRVRLLGVDTPESDQPYGLNARHCLSSLISGKKVWLYRTSTGKYKRTIALVYCDGVCVNRELVRRGAAWVYDKYCPADLRYEWDELEDVARTNRIGLWKAENPVKPSDWRHRY